MNQQLYSRTEAVIHSVGPRSLRSVSNVPSDSVRRTNESDVTDEDVATGEPRTLDDIIETYARD